MTELIEAVSKGDSATVSALLRAGADLNMRDEEGITPLHQAVFYGRSAIASMLIEAGADVNARVQSHVGRRDWSVLQFAVEGGYVDCVQVLLDANADLYSRDEEGQTAIDHATDEELQPDIACLLLQARWGQRQKYLRPGGFFNGNYARPITISKPLLP